MMLSVSIALCTYNGASYIQHQLDSISNQTVLPDQLVVCDDNSTDDTVAIVNKFAKKANFRVEVYVNDKNIGVNKNFEYAISKCDGDVIFLSDQDDIWDGKKICTILDVFDRNEDCGYVFSDANIVNENNLEHGFSLWDSIGFNKKRKQEYKNGHQLSAMLSGGWFVYGMSMAFLAKNKNHVLPINSNSTELTHDTWISLILTSVGMNGLCIDDLLVNYRQHANQVAGGWRKKEKIEFISKIRLPTKLVSQNYLISFGKMINAIEEIECHDPIKNQSIELLNNYLKHYNNRLSIYKTTGIKKIYLIFSEIFSGRYKKYSHACQSPIKDFFSSTIID